MKTNAARLLDKLGIPYQILSYEVDPDDLAALSTAQKVGLPPEQVFKTIKSCGLNPKTFKIITMTTIAIAVLRNVFNKSSNALKIKKATITAATKIIKLTGIFLPGFISKNQ
jgi:prolyl-tRNA editing enzyme YbaK/EbsC (Cys-tRNA(Pro) deacylase)